MAVKNVNNKKTKKQKQKQKQKQRQETNINIKIGDLSKKLSQDSESYVTPSRPLPPVVYQTLPQLTFYTEPDKFGRVIAKSNSTSKPSIVSETKPVKTILEDIGSVGTEGLVEILDKPTKRETLSELIMPVSKKQPLIYEPKPRSPLNIQMEKQPEQPIKKPQEQPSLFTPEPQSKITEPSMMSGETIFNERPEQLSITGFMNDSMRKSQTQIKTSSGKISKPQEMQRDIFSQESRREPALLEPPATPASIVQFNEPLPQGNLTQQLIAPFASSDPRSAGRDIRSKAGKLGGITSKKMTEEQKTQAYAEFAGIRKEDITSENIDEIRKQYFRSKKRESRQKQKEQLPSAFL